jgi:AraC-like DNA-binding protein
VNYIEKEKPYVNTAFSLHDISRSLNIPHIRVTTCFSKQLKVSFPTYRNKLRVEHATELFRSGAHLNTSIEGIAAMSGFKSKSIFYTAFKAVYGVNPMEWMKENL